MSVWPLVLVFASQRVKHWKFSILFISSMFTVGANVRTTFETIEFDYELARCFAVYDKHWQI